jgi:hypothetical protein
MLMIGRVVVAVLTVVAALLCGGVLLVFDGMIVPGS